MTHPTPPALSDAVARLSTSVISLEEFLWEARSLGFDRREAARSAVAAEATSTPGSQVVRGPAVLANEGASAQLRVGLWLPVDGMDPAIATYRTSRLATEQLYSTLMALGPDGRPYPDLAEWIEVSDDACAYTFGIVRGVRFHDGSPLSADDVAFTFRRLLDMGEAYHFDPWVATIAGADVLDPLTVRLRLTQPTGPILTWLAFCGTGIVPRAAVEAGRDLMREPIGSGPFRLADPWAGGDDPIRLVRHDASARGGHLFAPRLAALEFAPVPSAEERADALAFGRIDLDAQLAPERYNSIAGIPGMVVHETPDSRWHWLVVNCRRPPLSDVRVRRALSAALDRGQLLEAGFDGHGTTLEAGVIAPWSWAALPAADASVTRDADPAAARALLAAAGVRDGVPLAITASGGLPIAIRQAELIARQLRAVGLAATVDIVDGEAYAASVSRDGDFELATSYWGSPIWDPDDFVWMGLRSNQRLDVGSCSSSALDEMMERGRGTVIQADRRRAYDDLQRLALEQMPVVPTIQPAVLRGARARLKGYTPTPASQLRTLRDAWLES